MTENNDAIVVSGGATVNGVQQDTTILMARKGFDKWPSATDGLNQWAEKVVAQDLTDVKDMPIRDIFMSPTTGGLYNKNKSGLHAIPATRTAIGHLMSYVKEKPSNTLGVLLDLPLAVRSQVFAEYMQRPEPRTVVLRTGLADSEKRVIRAVVTDTHSQDKGDDMAIIASLRSLGTEILSQAKMRVIRQWDYTSTEIVLPNVGVQPKVGVTLYGRLSIINSETKGRSFEAIGGSMNLVCLNGMTRLMDSSSFHVRHTGDISFRVRQSVRGAIEAVGEHLNVFKDAYGTPLERPRADVISAFVKANELPETTGQAIQTLWDVDGERGAGDTLAGLVNSITRHAQSLSVESAITMEALAGETLHKGLAGLI